MLNRVERKVMDYLFEKCDGSKPVLITPKEILQTLLPKHELTVKQLDAMLANLVLDKYIDLAHSDHKGQLTYVISLKIRGEAWKRERAEIRRKLLFSVAWKIGLTLLAFPITWLLWYIFG